MIKTTNFLSKMDRKCIVDHCYAVEGRYPELLFFEIPSELQMKTEWMNFIFNRDLEHILAYVVAENNIICSRHFSTTSFTYADNGSKSLAPGAIPTIFPLKLRNKWADDKRQSLQSEKNEYTILKLKNRNEKLKKEKADSLKNRRKIMRVVRKFLSKEDHHHVINLLSKDFKGMEGISSDDDFSEQNADSSDTSNSNESSVSRSQKS